MARYCAVCLVLLLTITGCDRGEPENVVSPPGGAADRLIVSTVNYPLAYFAERIGGDLVDVRFPAPPDEDPAYWSPDLETITIYQAADLILVNGAGYASWIDRASLPGSKIVDTSTAFADRLIPLAGSITHSHGPEGAHAHGGWASTTWLDPELAIEQAASVSRAFISARRTYEPILNERFVALETDLRRLDKRLRTAAEALGDTPLLFSHPVYQYLIRRHGLNAVEIHWEPDEPPDDGAWTELDTILRRHPARWMLWEGEPLEYTVAGLHDLGVGSLLFDPCANTPETGDFMTIMEANTGSLETIAETLSR